MDVTAWLKAACDDAERRGLPELRPLLETLARSTAALRAADAAARADPPAPSTAKSTANCERAGASEPRDRSGPRGNGPSERSHSGRH